MLLLAPESLGEGEGGGIRWAGVFAAMGQGWGGLLIGDHGCGYWWRRSWAWLLVATSRGRGRRRLPRASALPLTWQLRVHPGREHAHGQRSFPRVACRLAWCGWVRAPVVEDCR